ncbi:MAG: cytochrome-c peroxidase [Myxococcaceae bacterium]
MVGLLIAGVAWAKGSGRGGGGGGETEAVTPETEATATTTDATVQTDTGTTVTTGGSGKQRTSTVVNTSSTTTTTSTSGSGGGLRPLSMAFVPRPMGGDIVNQDAAIKLGKALFWDQQTGGDGKVACATCHFNAGADNRSKNTMHPGPDGIFASNGVTGPGQICTLGMISNDDRVGSQGVVGAMFMSINNDPKIAADSCKPNHTSPFMTERRATGRQTPSAIGAVFNRNNFWDGRANHKFNGLDPFGGPGTTAIENASLASQAVGPPGSDTEMSCAGRPFNGPNSLGAKMLARKPLQWQKVDPTDSVLGSDAARTMGLTVTYQQMIDAAFAPVVADDPVNNFSRIFGQAIAAYESTLIPKDTKVDHFLEGTGTLTVSEKKGLSVFNGKGQCIHCHAGAELTDASVSFAQKNGLINEEGGDQGFHNIGVTDSTKPDSDVGRWAFSVSHANADKGAFKTPALRNVELTAPYFHNGGKPTLEAVVEFYDDGGDFANAGSKAKRMKQLGLDDSEKAGLVSFLKALTDPNVKCQRKPFDHPALSPPNGTALMATGRAGMANCQ